MHNDPKEIEVGMMPLSNDQVAEAAEACAPDHPALPLTAKQVKLAYQMLLPGMVYRLFLYLYGEVNRVQVDDAYEAVNSNDKIFDMILIKRIPPMRAVYELLIEREVIAREELGDVANEYLDRPDELQERCEAVSEPEAAPTYSVPAEVNVKLTDLDSHVPSKGIVVPTWDKIHLNCELGPKAHSPYTLLYDPNKPGE